MIEIDAPLDPEATDFSETAATFGDRIVAARDALGLTTEDLALRLGINIETLRNWEEDRAEPRANKMQIMAGVLNVSIVWLMSGDGEGPWTAPAGLERQDIEGLLAELREIRDLQKNVADRTRRLERRLLALVK